MSKITIMMVEQASDWITYCRAHFVKEALPSCKGIYMWPCAKKTPDFCANEEGWNLYLCGHGSEDKICEEQGAKLAEQLASYLPDKLGFIFVMSCKTGKKAAIEFYEELQKKGKNIIIKAPIESSTFTHELGFRVLDAAQNPSIVKPKWLTEYEQLKLKHDDLIDNAKQAVADYKSASKSHLHLPAQCKQVAQLTEVFWRDFQQTMTPYFYSIPGAGWVEIPKPQYDRETTKSQT